MCKSNLHCKDKYFHLQLKNIIFLQMFLMLKSQPNRKFILDLKQVLRLELYRTPRPMEQNGSKATMGKRLNLLPSANQSIMVVAAIQSHSYW